VAEVAHDLRSPLTSILFLSEALRNGQSGSLTELQKHQLGLIYAAALGLAGVTNDLMTMAQKQTLGHLDEAVAFSLHEMFEAVREMVAPQADAKRIRLRFGVQCADHRHGHPGRIGRVLLNLTTNAIRFTPEGGSVEVLAEPLARDTVQVSVRDTGQGIPPEQMAQLYEPFQKFQGREGFFFAASGLGLSIVRRLLEGLDSELTVDSKVGQGTRFSFVLSLPTPH
jgi:signal transduction histidine kinase